MPRIDNRDMKQPFTMSMPLFVVHVMTVACALVFWGIALRAVRSNVIGFWMIALCGVFLLLCWWHVMARILMFKNRMVNLYRRLLSGDYTTGIKITGWCKDEISTVGHLANRMSERLQIYDQLRGDQTEQNYQAFDMLFRATQEPVIVAKMEKALFQCNPALQELYGVNQEHFSFEAIEKQPGNAEFYRLFQRATHEGITVEGAAPLILPVRETRRDVFCRIVPLKNRKEKVLLAMAFIRPADAPRGPASETVS
jgi:PAS domain-containing protein